MPIKIGMELTQHKTVTQFMHYGHTEDKPVRDAAELVITGAPQAAGARA